MRYSEQELIREAKSNKSTRTQGSNSSMIQTITAHGLGDPNIPLGPKNHTFLFASLDELPCPDQTWQSTSESDLQLEYDF